MENEKFQELVLEQLARLTQETTETRIELKEFKEETNEHFGKIDIRLDRIEKKQDIIINQTAALTEFRTEANDKLVDDMDYFKVHSYNHTAKLTEDLAGTN